MNTTLSVSNSSAGQAGVPEKTHLRLGFVALSDAAPLVAAKLLEFGHRHGLTLELCRQPSWAAVRDKLLAGELDAAHALYGLVYGVQLGLGGPQADMAVLMVLNRNGQAITLSNRLADAVREAGSLKAALTAWPRVPVFGQTFPTGTHAMWLYYWLASAGINPFVDTKAVVLPPSHMVGNARAGSIDGFSVGEPWNHRGILDGVSVHAASSQDVWRDHPEKVVGTTGEFVRKYPRTCRAVVMAVLEASRWLDASAANRQQAAAAIAAKPFVDTSVDAIAERMVGCYTNGMGRTWEDPHHMSFFRDGGVNFPYLSDGMWFLTQHKRWGLLKEHPDYLGIARQINQIDLYKQAASALNIAVPDAPMRSSKLIDGVVWDGNDPQAYADGFEIRVPDR